MTKSSTRVRDRGQAVVETALVLPLVVMVALGALQVVIVGAQQIGVLHAARAGARAAAVDAAPAAAAERASTTATGLQPLDVDTSVTDGLVSVTVTYRARTDVPLIGPLLPDVTLHATITMSREPP